MSNYSYDFPDEIIDEYLMGSCTILAEELRKKYGGRIRVIVNTFRNKISNNPKPRKENVQCDIHWFLLLDNGRAVDISGNYDNEEKLVEHYKNYWNTSLFCEPLVLEDIFVKDVDREWREKCDEQTKEIVRTWKL